MPAPNHPDDKMTNKFSIVLFPLDCMSSDPVVTSKRIAEAGKKLARSPAAIGNLFLMAIGGVLPASIMRFFLTNSQATAIVSNLPGPSREISIWGHKLLDTMFWLPSLGDSGKIIRPMTWLPGEFCNFQPNCSFYPGLSVSFLSYANYLRIGLTIDAGMIDKGRAGAQCLIQGITDELMDMARSVGLTVMPEDSVPISPDPLPIFKIDNVDSETSLDDLNEDKRSAETTLIYDYENETPKSLNFLPCSSFMEKVPDTFQSNIVRTQSLSRLTKC